MSTELPLSVENMHKIFRQGSNRVEILKGINLKAERGEFIAIMGPSGSGKSTLLHVIAGLTGITEGKVLIGGKDISTLSDSRLTKLRREKVGFVFQSFNLIPTLNVENNIILPLLADGRDPDRKKLHHLTERLGIADKLKRMPSNLSGGEQQRVAIARALLPDPAIILADEPTGSLDTAAGQSFCRLLREFCEKDGRTILMVTHEPAVAVWANRTLVLKDGRLAGELKNNAEHNAHELAASYQDILSADAEV